MGSDSGTCPHCSIRKKKWFNVYFVQSNSTSSTKPESIVSSSGHSSCYCRHVENLQPCSTKNDCEKTICCKDNGRSVGRDLHSTEAAFARCVKKEEKTSWKRSFRLWAEGSVRNALLHSHEDLCLDAQHHARKLHQFISAIQVFRRCRDEALWSALSSLAELVSSRITERHWSLNIRWEVIEDNWTTASGWHTQI